MTKTELVNVVADKASLSKKEAAAAVNATFETISNALVAGDKVQLIGFGCFETRQRAAHPGLNPATKQQIMIPAKKTVAFKPSKTIKDLL